MGKIGCFGIVYLCGVFAEIAYGAFPVIAQWLSFLPGVNWFIFWITWRELVLMGIGVQFRTLELPIYNYTYADGIRFNLLGIGLWTVLYMYLDQIIPSEFGIPRSCFFCFSPKFWRTEVFGGSSEQNEESTQTQKLKDLENEEDFMAAR
jgi:hypothetical protein